MKLKHPENLLEVQFFKNLAFPVCIYVCSEWKRVQVSYLNSNFSIAKFITFHCVDGVKIIIFNIIFYIQSNLAQFQKNN